jgi:hypothetical protein
MVKKRPNSGAGLKVGARDKEEKNSFSDSAPFCSGCTIDGLLCAEKPLLLFGKAV